MVIRIVLLFFLHLLVVVQSLHTVLKKKGREFRKPYYAPGRKTDEFKPFCDVGVNAVCYG